MMKINKRNKDESSVPNEKKERQYHPPHKWQATTAFRIFMLIAMLLPTSTVSEPITANTVNDGQQQAKQQQQVISSDGANSSNGGNAGIGGGIGGSDVTVESLFHKMDSNHDVALSLTEFETNIHMLRDNIHSAVDNTGSGGGGMKQLSSSSTTPKVNKEFWNGFSTSTMMIIATEIGDKTFFIAAVLSMRNSRYSVFFGSVLALVCMTVLSTLMGLILPSFLPKSYTHIIAGVLFFYFGIKLMNDSRSMENKVSDELGEVEDELLMSRKKEDNEEHHHSQHLEDDDDHTSMSISPSVSSSILQADIESNNGTTSSGGGTVANSRSATPTISNSTNTISNNNNTESSSSSSKSKTTKSIFFQAYILTFLAEWGDRSQIATIALAADKDPYGVTFGACFGHALCTGMAVVGGRILASKISEKTVSFW
eukprot:CAMPEP_0198255184 /NCGR_PEP_ID=MMETSP1447-20131203/5365_1 /TAXON_ID=420782 /ORGANISM="Chaetoceros dichaeta, Strain CCMP1751" /LENGTH=425 /DNA_ID=CAMNT_0043941499 /DNA_START=90 /DNA_END=1364 /DNA_ORIENTATION=+